MHVPSEAPPWKQPKTEPKWAAAIRQFGVPPGMPAKAMAALGLEPRPPPPLPTTEGTEGTPPPPAGTPPPTPPPEEACD
jgi:hypothetical protein